MMHPRSDDALRAIALFEGAKGISAIVASLGLLSLAHHDVRHLAYALIGHFHLDPESAYPRRFLNLADLLANANLRTTILIAWGYAALRLTEAYGLWRMKTWAEWLAALSGGLYVPFEVSHLLEHATVINGTVLLFNVGVVAYMVGRLRASRTGK